MAIDVVNTKRAGRFKIDGVVLDPGANRLSDEDWQRLSGISYVQSLLAQGLLRTESVPEQEELDAPEHARSLKGLKKSEVERLVKECTSLKQLRQWLDSDGRKTTRELIEARAAEIAPKEAPKVD